MTFGSFARTFVLPAACASAVAISANAQASADTLSASAADIQSLIDQGQPEDAVAAARDFMRQVTDMVGFGVTNAQLIAGPATGFGVYDRRSSNVFLPGEPVYAYIEVYGFSLTPQENLTNRLQFDVSFTLDSLDGEQMTDALIPMGDINLESYSEPVDGYFHLTYRVTGAEGAFNLRTQVIDRMSGQSTQFTLPVVFAPEASVEDMDDK